MSAKAVTSKIVNVCGNSRGLVGMFAVVGLTVISITFNYQLGKLSAGDADDVSSLLMPLGYSMLDIVALFLCGYVAIKTQDAFRKTVAWVWFGIILSLSLWAAMSYAVSVDYRTQTKDHPAKVAAQQAIVQSTAANVATWQDNLDQTTLYKTKYQATLSDAQRKHQQAVDELNMLLDDKLPPALAIYYKVAPWFGTDSMGFDRVSPEGMATAMRMIWAAALTLSPLIVMMLIVAEFASTTTPTQYVEQENPTPPRTTPPTDDKPRDKKPQPKEPEHYAEKPTLRGNFGTTPAPVPAMSTVTAKYKDPIVTKLSEKVEGIKGHNKHTDTAELNGLRKAKIWLENKPAGRITRTKLQIAAEVKGREGMTRIIDSLIQSGHLVRLNNNQLAKPEKRRPILKSIG